MRNLWGRLACTGDTQRCQDHFARGYNSRISAQKSRGSLRGFFGNLRFEWKSRLFSGFLAFDHFAHHVAGEAANDDVLAQLSDLALDELIDSLVGVLDERLVEQADAAAAKAALSSAGIFDFAGAAALPTT